MAMRDKDGRMMNAMEKVSVMGGTMQGGTRSVVEEERGSPCVVWVWVVWSCIAWLGSKGG